MIRAAISGVGVVSAFGVGARAFFDGLAQGRAAVGPIRGFDVSTFPVRVGGGGPRPAGGRGRAGSQDRAGAGRRARGLARRRLHGRRSRRCAGRRRRAGAGGAGGLRPAVRRAHRLVAGARRDAAAGAVPRAHRRRVAGAGRRAGADRPARGARLCLRRRRAGGGARGGPGRSAASTRSWWRAPPTRWSTRWAWAAWPDWARRRRAPPPTPAGLSIAGATGW